MTTWDVAELFSLESAASALVPGRYSIAIDGRPYNVEPTKSTRRTLPVMREAQDVGAEPGEASLATLGGWWRHQTTWTGGVEEQQFDAEGAKRDRVWEMLGLDPWTKGQLSLLDAVRVWPEPLFAAFTVFSGTPLIASAVLGIDAVSIGGYGVVTEIIYVADTTRIGFWDGITFRTMTGLGGTIKALWIDQGYVWVGTTTNLYYALVNGTTTALTLHSAGNVDMIAGGHGKVVIGNGSLLSEVVLPATRTAIDTLRGTYLYTAGCSGPGQIYVSGAGAGRQVIFRTTLDQTTSALGKLVEACRLPDNELVTALHTYGNQVVVIGTTAGCRLALINADGSLTFGPLFGPACSGTMASYGRFVYYPGTFYDEGGIAKLDMTNFVDDLVPAWAPDLTSPLIENPRGVVINAGVPVVLNGSDKMYVVDPSQKRTSGWFDTGWIGFGVPIPKTWMDVALTHAPLAGSIDVECATEDGEAEPCGTSAAAGSTMPTERMSLGDRHTDVMRLVLTLHRDSVNTALGPILRSWLLHVVPAPARHDEILLSVIFTSTSANPREFEPLELDTFDEYHYLSDACATGRTVTLQEGRNTQQVQLLGLELHPTKWDYASGETRWWEGELLIRMQTV